MKTLSFLKKMSQKALNKIDLVRISAYSESPSVAYKAAQRLDWGVRNAKSCRFLSIIKRDYGFDSFSAFIYERYDSEIICFCECHMGRYDLQAFLRSNNDCDSSCGCCEDAVCFHVAHSENWNCPFCNGEGIYEGKCGEYEEPNDRFQRVSNAIQYITETDYYTEVIYDDVINAYADGSTIYITIGLLEMLDDDELAFVIAHEVMHNKLSHPQRHGKMYSSYLGAVIESAQIPGGFIRKTASVAAVGIVGALCTRYASRYFERESDRTAKIIMQQAGFNGWKAVQVMRKLGYSEGGLFSTHPGSEERIEYLEND